jgi:hypothetical protein
MSTTQIVVLGIITAILFFIAARFIFALNTRGIAPFRVKPWVVNEVLQVLRQERIKENPVILSINSGRFGFLYWVGSNFQNSHLRGVEQKFSRYILGKIQILLRFAHIQLIKDNNLYGIKVADSDIIFCSLTEFELKQIPKKLKYECRSGTIVLSENYAIPSLTIKKSINVMPPIRQKNWLFRQKKEAALKTEEKKKTITVFLYVI